MPQKEEWEDGQGRNTEVDIFPWVMMLMLLELPHKPLSGVWGTPSVWKRPLKQKSTNH